MINSILSWLKKKEVALLLVLVLLALLVRLYRLSNPLLDWHAWRQADTASVTREYLKHGIDPLRPTFLDISATPSGTDNPLGYRMVEFPILHIVTASLLFTLPQLPLEQTSRVISIGFSLLGLVALYGIVRSISGRRVAVVTAIAYSFLPFTVFYSRTVLPEPVLIGVILASLYSFMRWLATSRKSWYLSAFTLLLISYLLKPYTIFFTPVFVALAYLRFSWRVIYNPWLWLLAVLTPAPMLWWRSWITQYPEGVPGNTWLFNGNDIRFKPSWVRWLFFERLNRLMVGTLGSILLFANLLHLTKKEILVYGSWWLGMLAYLSILATGNVQHDYYQALLIPIVAISVGRGAITLFGVLTEHKLYPRNLSLFVLALMVTILYGTTLAFGWQLSGYFPEKIWNEFVWMVVTSVLVVGLLVWRMVRKPLPLAVAGGVVLAISIGSVMLSWQYVSGYFNVNHWQYVRAGQAVQAVADADALIIAPNMGDTQLLFQTDRKGWPIGGGVEEKIAQGADYYLSASFDDEAKTMMSRFATVTQTDEFILIDLHTPLTATSAGEKLQ